jgi:hypothetical protein
MDLSVYSRPRTFQQPSSRVTGVVSILSVLWALLLGPVYYWKKGARIEAILLCVASVPLLMMDESSSYISAPVLWNLTALVWAASVVFAPVFLMLSYRRRGWIEIVN